ncbi:hypothetical protein G3A43_07710 [Paraburkholderia aspalathi]|nr:hypothetical protein [Paraburkholderia aspalathi]MBK3780141.1 hypothetical protein [Paraburkholderia aspalathi]
MNNALFFLRSRAVIDQIAQYRFGYTQRSRQQVVFKFISKTLKVNCPGSSWPFGLATTFLAGWSAFLLQSGPLKGVPHLITS